MFRSPVLEKSVFLFCIAAVCFLGPFLAHAAFAADYYVDPVGGSNENSGLRQEDAFRTITHALGMAGTTPATIHLEAGAYSADTNGETFPLSMTSATSLVGQGPGLTTLLCNQDTEGIHCQAIGNVAIEALSIETTPSTGPFQWPIGVRVRGSDGQVCIRHCNIVGFWMAISAGPTGSTTTIRHSTFVAGGVLGGTGRMTIEDCTFIDADLLFGAEVRRCEFYDGGISFGFGYNLIEKCKIIGGGIEGDCWYARPGVSGETIIRDCLIADAPDDTGVKWKVWSFSGDMPSTFASIQPMLPGRSMTLSDEFSLEMSNCTVSGNRLGIVCLCDSKKFYAPCHVRISDCRVLGHPRGGIHVRGIDGTWFRDAVVHNSFVSGNSEDTEYYGAIHSYGLVSLTVQHCTVVNNSLAGIRAFLTDQTTVRNSIFWGNHPYEILNEGGSMSLANCCVEGGYEGTGNIEADPLFVSGPLGEYYLSSVAAGQDADSPCLDAGYGTPAEYGVAWMTTTTDNAFDAGATDIGYHYSATPPTIVCQITTGGTVAAVLDEAPVLRPGDTLSAQVTVQNDGWTFWADVFAAFIAADGTVFYITPNGLTSAFTPYAIDVRLDDGLHFGPAPVFEFALNEHVVPGTYAFAAALSRAREPFRPIGDIAFAAFAFELE